MRAPPDPEMRSPAGRQAGRASSQRGDFNTSESNAAATELQARQLRTTSDVLSTLRLVSVRLGLIRAEINDIGIALKNGRIHPDYARMLAERAAPGCYDQCAEDIQ
jgi:hypothetical protein